MRVLSSRRGTQRSPRPQSPKVSARSRLRSRDDPASFGEARRPASAKASAVRHGFSEGGSACGAKAAAWYVVIVVALVSGGSVNGQSARGAPDTVDRVRARFKTGAKAGGTTVDQSQAEALTLTLSKVAARPVQNWIRTAGTIDRSGKLLEAVVKGPDAALVKTGQRVRAFPPSSKSSMYQAFVTRVVPHASEGNGSTVQAALASTGRENTTLYVMEIVVERGPFLSVPNEAIIEEGDKHIVYVQKQAGQYVPQEIHTGIQGELYTQVLDGVREGDEVVTFGSFFIDAEHKLKGIDPSSHAATAK